MMAVAQPVVQYMGGLAVVLVGAGLFASGVLEWCRLEGTKFSGTKAHRWHTIVMPLFVVSCFLLGIGAAMMHSSSFGG
ncbi:MAG TPA: hypothetical protein VEH48_01435 [Candidatus Nitrosopolaris sp.]|nr:hypothetical protein [Candidatus Nitrosopolaris sp.]